MIALGTAPFAVAAARPDGGSAPAPAPTFNSVVIEGDSITRNVTHPDEGGADTADRYSTLWKASQPGKTVHIRAVNSRTTGTSAQLNDNDNTLFSNVAEDAAYAPDLLTMLIGANDFTLGTDAAYRTNLTNLRAAYATARPAMKVAWSGPLAYNPTGTPHPQKANFDTQRASLMAACRNPAVWGQWADYYLPLGEHPDFGNPATAAPLFGDAVHPNEAGHALMFASYRAAMDTLVDTARVNAAGPYQSVWDAFGPFTGIAVGETVTRRVVVSGLAWTGRSEGVSATGAGSPAVKTNGKTAPGYSYNGDVIDLTLNASGSFETDTAISLTIGGETRTLTYRTAANVTPAAYSHGDVIGVADSASPQTFSGLTFANGRAVVFVMTSPNALAADAVKLDGVAMTFRRRESTADLSFEMWDAPVAAGAAHVLEIAYSAGFFGNKVVSYGTITNGAFVSATGNAPAFQSGPHETPSVTVPANGIAIAAFAEYSSSAITPATVKAPGTLVDEGNNFFNGDYRGLAVAGRTGTGPVSFNYGFGTHPRMIAVYGAA